MRSWLRELLLAVFPRAISALLAVRSRRLSHRLIREWGVRELNQRLVARLGNRVVAGPFGGLVLSREAARENLGPLLLGTYESELHAWLEELRRKPVSRAIDIGCRIGYYAVGLARWFPEVDSIAFDVDPWARRVTRETARLNGAARVRVEGFADPSGVASLVLPGTVLVSDCEGYEERLFVQPLIGALEHSWILVETHEQFAAGVGARLVSRFASSHTVTRATPVLPQLPPGLEEALGPEDGERALCEFRGDQEWLFFRPRVEAT